MCASIDEELQKVRTVVHEPHPMPTPGYTSEGAQWTPPVCHLLGNGRRRVDNRMRKVEKDDEVDDGR